MDAWLGRDFELSGCWRTRKGKSSRNDEIHRLTPFWSFVNGSIVPLLTQFRPEFGEGVLVTVLLSEEPLFLRTPRRTCRDPTLFSQRSHMRAPARSRSAPVQAPC